MTYAFTYEEVSPSSSWDLGLFVLGLNFVLEAEIQSLRLRLGL